jgi:hypothetical protein
MIQQSTEIEHRDQFAELCNHYELLGLAIEIGVDQAVFAETFLRKWHGRYWFGVDPYTPYDEVPWNREGDFISAVWRLHQFGGRGRIVRDTSLNMAKIVADQNLLNMRMRPCFLYLDDEHTYPNVRANLHAWWPLITPGGIGAGHDFDPTHDGVRLAVAEFFAERNLDVHLTHERPGIEGLPSWYVRKPCE